MMRTIRISEAEAIFPTLLAAVEAGEEVAITRHGRVVARMLPGTRGSAGAPPQRRWGATGMASEVPARIATELVAPLD
jgi:antitoxin (DNA-binding transcriptional repressor) of toxin-antitoxin stability system